jgi:hypothetical protein
MNFITQPGVHPDAESLNAFVEQALPATERQQILEHLAACNRCREVLFLAQEAAGVEGVQTIMPLPEKSRTSPKWFTGWRWTWVPATALAGLVGFAVLHHIRSTPSETDRVARNALQLPIRESSSAKPEQSVAKPGSPEPPEKQAAGTKTGSATSDLSTDQVASAKKAPRSDKLQVVVGDKSESPEEMRSAASAPSVSTQTLSRNQKPASTGGPYVMNDSFQQQTMGQHQENAQDQLHSARYSAKVADAAGSTLSVAAADRADAQNQTSANAPAPMPTREVALQAPKSSGTAKFDEIAPDSKKKVAILPNGTSAISVASAQGRTVAIDASGSVFLSEAPGRQWMPVATQWTGRAIVVRALQPSSQAGTTPQLALFELVNNGNETWMSSDGMTWIAKPLSPP